MQKKDQKKVLLMSMVLTLFAIIIVFGKMSSNINTPVQKLIEENQKQIRKYATTQTVEENELTDIELKAKDTDTDGISDFDELNVFGTSPYLEDTDSDGMDDFSEIQKGSDPNCGQGQDCHINDGGMEIPGVSQVGIGVPMIESGEVNQVTADQRELILKILGGAASFEDIKDLLVSQGASMEDLDKVEEEDLMNLYRELSLEVQKSLNE